MSSSTSQIRNIALIGHRGCGKTTLTEAMLFSAGATKRLGRVDDGNSISDFEPEERTRKISIGPALCNVTQKGTKINIIDTPGYAEFFSEVAYCLWVADCAVLVVDAAAGVEVHTHKLYQISADMGLPMVVVVNKMSGEHAEFEASVASINEMLQGAEAVPMQIPVGTKGDFTGVADLLTNRVLTGSDNGGTWGPVAEDLEGQVETARDALIDAVAATDEALIEKYLETGTLSEDELVAGLAAATAAGQIVPVMMTDAYNCLGIGALLDGIVALCPAPDLNGTRTGFDPKAPETEIVRNCSDSEPFAAVVFKTLSDPYVGRISLLRVVSGRAVADANVINASTGERERLSGLATVQGNKTTDVSALMTGDLGCVTKLEGTLSGGTLCDAKSIVAFAPPELAAPMHAAAASAASHADEDKLSAGLSRLAEEDVGFTFGRDPSTGEMLVRGMGALHLDVVVEKLARKFEASVTLAEPKVPYRETISKSVRVQGRHKKQTGGRGQFGDVWIRMAPLPRESGFEFVNEIKGATVPTNYIPAVEKGVVSQLQKGTLTGSPVVDVQVTLDDGSSHPVDSSDQAFQMAGQIAVRAALAEANPVLLEPVMTVEVTAPEDLMGDIMSDLSGRRGRIQGTEGVAGGLQLIRGTAPFAELRRYAADLRSISQGRATYTMYQSGYEEVPAHLMPAIIAEHERETEE